MCSTYMMMIQRSDQPEKQPNASKVNAVYVPTLLSGYRQTPVHCVMICAVAGESKLIEWPSRTQDS